MFKITGIEELQRRLSALQKSVGEVAGKHDVPLLELFPDSFIQRHSKFDSLQAMVDASGIGSAENIGGEAWNQFVTDSSAFPGWDAMLKQAGTEWVAGKLEV